MAKYSSKGTKVYFGTASPPTTEVVNLEGVEIDLGERIGLLDTSDHNNTTGIRSKLDAGWKEPAKLSLDIMYDPADTVHEDLRLCELTYAARNVKVVLPDAGNAEWVGACRVASFSIAAPVDGKLTARVSIELLGAFTFTA